MELVTEKLNLKIDGVAYELSYPSVKQVMSFEKDEKEIKVSEILNLISDCGLPKEVAEGLQANHLNAIVGALMGKQKS